MATSSQVRRRPAATFAEQATALAWGAWVELGVSGWTETHSAWAIDPEPLITFTAFLGDEDARLRDEATDWCVRNWRYVSKTRLKNLVREQPPAVRDAFGPFAATVSEHAGVVWPYATEQRRFTVTGRSAAPQLDKPSMVWLRLRAMFGLGARTEILRFFLAQEDGRASAATISAATNYTKRNISEECETLAKAGVLSVRPTGNRFYYSLANRGQLEAFVGSMPIVRPNWIAMFNVARHLVNLESSAATGMTRTLAVKVRIAIDEMEADLDELEIDPPRSDVRGEDLWPAIRSLGKETLGKWSLGRWHVPPRKGGAGRSTIRRIS
ncbi:MAG: hypothetical protein JJE52_03965 [Acidimicrobiia bacterium]|nr:hypothetical protein [Acidimicrobiia bacterium]